ncbi:MAG: two-component system response regulator BaeR [Pseudohongiellaceae bacterium]|jgi:two-component system response regulator BaeR
MIDKTILIVEDEPKLAQLLTEYLQRENFQTHSIHHGDEVMPWLQHHQADAILLDLMLPGKDGLTLCKEIRQKFNTPILMTTAKVEEIDRLLGLELGADDYICKPYSLREVVARVKAVLRRAMNTPKSQNDTLFIVDLGKQCIQFKQQTLELSSIEFQLINKLSKEPGRIFSRNQLMDIMYNDHRIVSDRTIDSHIKKIRQKLQQYFPDVHFIHSIYGAGYRFDIVEA